MWPQQFNRRMYEEVEEVKTLNFKLLVVLEDRRVVTEQTILHSNRATAEGTEILLQNPMNSPNMNGQNDRWALEKGNRRFSGRKASIF